MAVVINAALLIAYTIITASVFEPWWIGFTIGFWIAIVQLTIVIFIKYYQSYYHISFFVQFSIFIGLVLFIIWTVIMAIYVLAVLKNNVLALVAFVLGSCGYTFAVVLSMAFLKLWSLTEKQNLPWSLKLLFSLAFLIVGAIGALIIAVSDGDVWGHVLCGCCVYLLVMLYVPTKRLWISIGFVIVLFGYAIFAIIYYHDYPRFVLQGLSMILIIIFLFFSVNFVRKYLENKEMMSK